MSKKPAVSNLEEHFLLQVPDHIAARLQALIQQAENAPGDVAVTFDEGGPDKPQSAALRVDGTDLPARLCKLPTIVETHKSLDGETYYKTGQVGQMLVVDDEEAALPTDLELRDGLAPPTANIRKRKWRTRPPRSRRRTPTSWRPRPSRLRGCQDRSRSRGFVCASHSFPLALAPAHAPKV